MFLKLSPGQGSTSPAARAFEEILGEHLDALYRTALRLCRGQRADAEDLLQDSVIRAFGHLDQLRSPAAAKSWLFTILVRTHLNRQRSARRRAEVLETELDEPAFEQALADWQPSSSPEDVLGRGLSAEQVRDAVNALPSNLREVLWLADAEGLAGREIATMLDLPEGTVGSRLYRARQAVRALLEKGMDRPVAARRPK